MGERNVFSIGFDFKNSIGYLDVEKMTFSRMDNVDREHFIFKNIQAPFDWYFHNEIMIIPDPILSPRKNWNKTIFIDNQEINCKGKFVVFFHFEKVREGIHFATSLTLPEFRYIENELVLN